MKLEEQLLRGFDVWTRDRREDYELALEHFYSLYKQASESPACIDITERIGFVEDALKAGLAVPKALWIFLGDAGNYLKAIGSSGFSASAVQQEHERIKAELRHFSEDISDKMAHLRGIREKLTLQMLKEGGIAQDE